MKEDRFLVQMSECYVAREMTKLATRDTSEQQNISRALKVNEEIVSEMKHS